MTSHHAQAWAWDRGCHSSGEKLVLLALAAATGGDEDDARVCWPSFARIAEQTGLTPSMVKRHVAALADQGLITKIERRHRADGTLGTWVYTVNFTTDTPVSLDQGHSSVSHEPVITEPVKTNTRDDEFDRFWAGYPRKESKPAARTAWKKIKPDEGLALMLGLSLWDAYWKRTKVEKRFIPEPSTWLNKRKWEDDVPDAKVKPPPPPKDPNWFIVQLEDGSRRNTMTGELWNPLHDRWEPDPDWLYQEQRKPQ